MQQAGVPTFVQARNAVMAKVREQKKEVKAKALAEQLISKVKGGASLAGRRQVAWVAESRIRAVQPHHDAAREPAGCRGLTFSLPVGALSGVIDTPEGLYVVKVLQKVPADSAEFVKTKDQPRVEN